MLRRLLTFLILIAFAVPATFAQQAGTVTGTVTDAESGETLPGVNIQLAEIQRGAATSMDGAYRLEGIEPGEYTLRATFVGYQSSERQVTVRAGETTTVNVQLESGAVGLDEVVVTGLARQQTKAEASVSVTSIDAAELSGNADFQSMEQLLQGSTPGLRVSQTSGNVGAGIRFKVRGNVSLNSDGQPLIFIDGTRINQDEIEGFDAGGQGTSPLADLNPDNIASVNVLKGPSAAALYGTDGADGVVLIETKSGRQGQDLQVNYSGTLGYTERVADYDSSRFITADAANRTFREGNISENQVSVSGAFNDVSYFASYGRRDTEGIQRNNEGTRNNLQANFNVRPNDEFRIQANTGFTINEYSRPQNDNNLAGVLGNTLLTPAPYVFRDSTEIDAIDDQFRIQRFTGSLRTTYTPESVSGLRIQASAGADVSSRREDLTFPVGRATSFPGIDDGERSIFTLESRQYNGDLNVQYSYNITDEFSATSTVGTQVFTESERQSNLTAQSFGSPKITDIGTGANLLGMGENLVNQRSAGVFARQTFDFQNRYSLDLSVRRDWATKLLAETESSFTAWYPSVRGNVRLSQFDFAPDFFTQLKLRGAFGQSGSLPDVTDTQELRIGGERGGFGAGGVVSSAGDPGLNSERITEIEGGLDATVSERYTLGVTYYYQTTSESIVDFPPAPSTGLGNFTVPRNVGEITGQGVETQLDIAVLDLDNYQVDVSANYSYQTSEVKQLGGQLIQGGFERNVIKEGLPPGAFFGFEVDGAQFTENGVYNGPNIVDQNDDGEITLDDRVQLGNPNPDHYGGFSINARLFGDLTISGRAEYQVGQQVYNGTYRFATRFGNNPRFSELSGQILGPDGEAGTGNEPLSPGTSEYRSAANEFAEFQNSDRVSASNFLEDADFLKIREIGIGYDFTGLVDEAVELPVREFRVRLSGRNLFTFTEYGGPDPQVNQTGARTITQGTDFLTLQTPRTYTATLSVGF
jgi:TonB-dependent SusC/RagA subfamily outer membrane receptor